MTDDVKALIAEADEITKYADEQGHHGASRVIRQLVAALEAATVAPAVDREALVKFFDRQGLAGPNVMASELIASGIIRDVRDVHAEVLNPVLREVALTRDSTTPKTPFEHGFVLAAKTIYRNIETFAQAIREARND